VAKDKYASGVDSALAPCISCRRTYGFCPALERVLFAKFRGGASNTCRSRVEKCDARLLNEQHARAVLHDIDECSVAGRALQLASSTDEVRVCAGTLDVHNKRQLAAHERCI
jgi:hypothetical protein